MGTHEKRFGIDKTTTVETTVLTYGEFGLMFNLDKGTITIFVHSEKVNKESWEEINVNILEMVEKAEADDDNEWLTDSTYDLTWIRKLHDLTDKYIGIALKQGIVI